MVDEDRGEPMANGYSHSYAGAGGLLDKAMESFRELRLKEMPFGDPGKLHVSIRQLTQRIPAPPARIMRASTLLVGFVLFFVLTFAVFGNPAVLSDTVDAMNSVLHLGHRGPLRECSQISKADFDRARSVPRVTAWTFAHGKHVEGMLQAPTPICIIVAVPQTPFTKNEPQDYPIPSKGPDNLHLLLKSPRVTYTFPPLMPLPDQVGLNETVYNGTLLYYAERNLIDPGSYEVQIEQEWSNWRWAREWNLTNNADGSGIIRFRTGATLKFKSAEDRDEIIEADIWQKSYNVSKTDMFPAILNVQGVPPNLKARPVCNGTLMPNPGRWLLNKPDAQYPIREMVDEWGYGWEGDECRMEYYTDRDMIDCLGDSVVHVLGNSNCRRITKTLMSGGRWCKDVYGKCQQEDSEEWDVKLLTETPQGALEENSKHLVHHWSFTDEPAWYFDYGHQTKLRFLFLRSLSGFYRDWVKRFYSPGDINLKTPVFIPGTTVKKGAKAHPPPLMGPSKADFLLVGFASWDAAFDNTFDEFNATLPVFRDALMEAYPDIPIVLRLGNGMCCKDDYGYWRQRYTGTRIQHINDLIKAAFRVTGNQGMEGRVTVLDPLPLTGRPEVVKDYGEVFNNHPRSSHVRIETQMLLNAVCERDPETGIASLKRLPEALRGMDQHPADGVKIP